MESRAATPSPEDLLAHAAFVRSIAFDLVRDFHEAEDIAQETLTRAFAKPATITTSVKGWLAGITRNVVRMRRRADSRRVKRDTVAALEGTVPSAAETSVRMEVLGNLTRAVDGLDEPYRTTLLLRYYDRLMPAEIARRTGVPVKTVKTRLHRALARLRERLDRKHKSRAAWALVLLPLRETAAAAGATTIVSGAILMLMKTKFVIGLAILALLTGVVISVSGPTAAPSMPPAEVPEPVPPTPPAEPVIAAGIRDVKVVGSVFSDETGGPVEGARILFGISEASADHRGQWSLTVPSSGFRMSGADLVRMKDTVAVSATGYAPVSADVAVPLDRGMFMVPTFWLRRVAARVNGRVTDPAGHPVQGATVALAGRRRVTTADGRFGPVGVSAGPLSIHAWSPDWPRAVHEMLVPPGDARVVNVEIVLPDAVPAEGIVTDPDGNPVAGARITSYVEVDRVVHSDARGRFHWPLPNGGGADVVVECPGYIAWDVEFFVQAGLTTRIVLRRAASIRGRALLPDGTPAPDGLRIMAHSIEEGMRAWSTTSGEGSFVLDSLFPERTAITVWNGGVPQQTVEIDLEPGQRIDNFEIRLSADGSLAGTISDARTGEPIGGARIGDSRGGYPALGFNSDSDGKFHIPWEAAPRSGTWARRILFSADGYETRSIPLNHGNHVEGRLLDVLLVPERPAGIRVVDGSGRPAAGAFARGETRGPQRMQFADAEGRIVFPHLSENGLRFTIAHHRMGVWQGLIHPAGPKTVVLKPVGKPLEFRVVDENGDPVPDAYAITENRRGPLYPADENGNISAQPIAPGRHSLRAPGRETLRSLDQVKPGETVVLRPSSPITGRIVDGAGRPLPGVAVGCANSGATTDGRGRFRIEGIAAGEVLLVSAGDTMVSCWASAGGEPVTIRLNPGKALLRFATPEGEPVEELGELRVSLLDRIDADTGAFMDGDWSAQGTEHGMKIYVPAERIRLSASFAGGPLVLYTLNDLKWGEERSLVYDPGRKAGLRGRVLDHRHRPVAGAEIGVAQADFIAFAETDERGQIRITDTWALPSGRVSLVVHSRGEQPPKVTAPVDLASNPEVEVVLAPPGRIQGFVQPAGGKIRVLHETGLPGEWVQIGPDGSFRIAETVAPGERRVEIRQPRRLPQLRPVRVLEDQATELSLDLR